VRVSLGLFGACMPIVLMPAAITLVRLLGIGVVPWYAALPLLPLVMIVYYVVWEYGVGFLNREVAIG
jgi:hypothetical protein